VDVSRLLVLAERAVQELAALYLEASFAEAKFTSSFARSPLPPR